MLAAVRLDHWGLVDWADREYRRVITAPTLSAQQIIPSLNTVGRTAQ